MTQFDWDKTLNWRAEKNAPVTVEVLETICGKNVVAPRIVSAMAMLLFTRNRNMNTLQAVNSLFLFNGHVRSSVYTSFNRAGWCLSHCATLKKVDAIGESFDSPVKEWSAILSGQAERQQPVTSAGPDHDYTAMSPQSFNENGLKYEHNDHEYSAVSAEDNLIIRPRNVRPRNEHFLMDHDYGYVPHIDGCYPLPDSDLKEDVGLEANVSLEDAGRNVTGPMLHAEIVTDMDECDKTIASDNEFDSPFS